MSAFVESKLRRPPIEAKIRDLVFRNASPLGRAVDTQRLGLERERLRRIFL